MDSSEIGHWLILLLEEIRLTTWDVQNPVNNGIKYQPQLVQDFFHQQYGTCMYNNKDILDMPIFKTAFTHVSTGFVGRPKISSNRSG